MARLNCILLLACVYFAHTVYACRCKLMFSPVCGSDGNMYQNQCLLDCEKSKGKPHLEYTRNCQPNTLKAKPVCGSDGKTYPNDCRFQCAKAIKPSLEAKHQGDCRNMRSPWRKELPSEYSCDCPYIYRPVCGSDGKTYPNPCVLACAQSENPWLKISNFGHCRKEERRSRSSLGLRSKSACVCPYNYQPICGSDGKTYPNPCSFNCAKAKTHGLEIREYGQCSNEKLWTKSSCICPYDYLPVCGTDGKTYPNLCSYTCAQSINPKLEIKEKGECRDEELRSGSACNSYCPRYSPICGSDGITYPNPCIFDCAQNGNPSLEVREYGECSEEELPSCACPFSYQPLCGSDGKTYPNDCYLDCATSSNPNLVVKYDGECEQGLQRRGVYPCDCSREYSPVCASDGATYSNECTFYCERNERPDLQLLYHGECAYY
ncbi:kazal-type serine protease inhibitor domain-containing protein [Phthorimaea operculella]|nr:kazal-type serine protease inhibitor domain-containing protein [Phthorimaea operculella]